MQGLAVDDPERTQILLASDTWENVSATKTLITPIECKSLWDTFLVDTKNIIIQANAFQEANKQGNTWAPVISGVAGFVVSTVGVRCLRFFE